MINTWLEAHQKDLTDAPDIDGSASRDGFELCAGFAPLEDLVPDRLHVVLAVRPEWRLCHK